MFDLIHGHSSKLDWRCEFIVTLAELLAVSGFRIFCTTISVDVESVVVLMSLLHQDGIQGSFRGHICRQWVGNHEEWGNSYLAQVFDNLFIFIFIFQKKKKKVKKVNRPIK